MLDTQIDVHDDDGDDKDGDDAASDSDLTVTNPNDPPSTVVVKLTNSEEAEKCAKCPRNDSDLQDVRRYGTKSVRE